MSGIVGILLAAGSARRFAGHKLSAELPDGEPVAVRALRKLAGALSDVTVVTRPGDARLAALLSGTGVRLVENARAAHGMGGSIAAGVAASPDADGWLIALADMPWIRQASIRRVIAALQGGASLAAPSFDGRRGHPVGFAAPWKARLLALSGEDGARSLLRRAAADLVLVQTTDPGIHLDVDRPADLKRRFGVDAVMRE